MYYRRKMAMLALAGIGFGQEATAVEWELKGDLGQQVEYNDNISLNTLQDDSVVGYVLRPRLEARRQTSVLDIAFEGQGDIRRYDDSLWDCDNYNLSLNGEYKTRRNTFSLKGKHASTCSYIQQVTDTGLRLPNTQSDDYLVAPKWTWEWTKRDQLILDTSYSKISYDNPSGGGGADAGLFTLIGNETYTVNLGEKHEWSRRLSLTGNVFYSNIEYSGLGTSTENGSNTQNLFGFELGANYKFDQQWTFNVSGGPVWVDGAGLGLVGVSPAQDSSLTLGSNVNVNVSYTDKVSRFSIGYANAVDPSAIGQTLQTHSAFAKYAYQLTRHLLLDLTGDFINNRSLDDGQSAGSQFDRTYISTAASLAWNPTRNWQLKGSYIYTWQDYQQDQGGVNIPNVQDFNIGSTNSNAVMLFLNYAWDGIRSSR